MATTRPPIGTKTLRLACLLLAPCSLLAVSVAQAADKPLLDPLFQDHAVVQRDRAIPVWGQASPGESLKIALDGKTVSSRAGADGHWQASLPALPAGGPYTLSVIAADGSSQTAKDILVGDVWLCSGQSNMELQVRRTLNLNSETSGANNDRIRMLTVPQTGASAPQDHFAAPVQWKSTTPQNVPDFSATCYYFARELQKTVDVPMGLINASLGGSRIEPWLSAQALRKVGGYDEALDTLALHAKDPQAAAAQWGTFWAKWWSRQPQVKKGDEPWNPAASDAGWKAAPKTLVDYQTWGVPELASYTGMLWYRTTVTLTKQQAAQDATLAIGNVDEIDQTWVNGRGVGSSSYGGSPRIYRLPHGLLHAGKNLIVINDLNTYLAGGMMGPSDTRVLKFADGSSVPLDTNGWQYREVPRDIGTPPLAPWLTVSGKTTLYNGMIAPLGHYAFRGALWYQGESNTGEADQYRRLLEAYRGDLRAQFGAKLPLLIVQLSSYGPAPTKPAESGWAGVREAERLVAAEDPHSALAVAVDIGERYDIHPANKQELGRRLARAARHVVYGESLSPSGPLPVAATREGDTVAVSFSDVTGKLVAYSSNHPIGFELCGTQANSCSYADADLRDGKVLLHLDTPPAHGIARVRYCWADSPFCTLYDEAGLPAVPFQLDITSSPH
ncbi:sialate O-acetylesterase [Rhodanobacter sp. Root627]|uniref:sialate O-acetylesterase n=1 Tax=Rhodanobacter sp. Root627 TaxID=1736572 RepID=UPI0009E9580A|nr:sialate O-acetylesterase [Rhodanobacter sp. Root627]